MKKKLIVFAIICLVVYLVLFICGEYRKKNRSHHLVTFSVCNNLKAEKFEVSSLTDLYSIYLTDSTNFREFIDTYHYYETIQFECHGDIVVMKKFNTDEGKPELIESKVYSLSLLKGKANYK
jgi:hypothetical protein